MGIQCHIICGVLFIRCWKLSKFIYKKKYVSIKQKLLEKKINSITNYQAVLWNDDHLLRSEVGAQQRNDQNQSVETLIKNSDVISYSSHTKNFFVVVVRIKKRKKKKSREMEKKGKFFEEFWFISIDQTYLSVWSNRRLCNPYCDHHVRVTNILNHIDCHANFGMDRILRLLTVLFR